MGILTALVCILFIYVSPCTGHTYEKYIKAKLGNYVKGVPWKHLGWKADIDGSMILSVLQKYKLPLQGSWTNNGYIYNPNPRSCTDIIVNNKKDSNKVYTIYPLGKKGIKASCDMTTDGGGWTVFQRRFNGNTNFYRNWKSYREGFGDPAGEYWLGNEALHQMTRKGNCKLRIDMVTTKNYVGYAVYQNFSIASEKDFYKLKIGKYSGTAGDSPTWGLSVHNGMKFSTLDKDNDQDRIHCAIDRKSGFWFNKCTMVNLNAVYNDGFYWSYWGNTRSAAFLKQSKMMLKC